MKLFNVNILWDWTDFGIVLKLFKNSSWSDYYGSIDIQVLWLNIWIEVWKKANKGKSRANN
jgi:hypothetical protein